MDQLTGLNSFQQKFFSKYFFKCFFFSFNAPNFQLAVPSGNNFEVYGIFVDVGETYMLDKCSMTAIQTFSKPDEC